MARVQDCTIQDLGFLVEKAFAFNARFYDVDLNPDKLVDYLTGILTSDEGVALRTETGAITGVLVSDPCRDWEVLVETAWYSEGTDGLRLLKAFEARGKELEVNEIRMTTLEVNPGVDRVLGRLGYTPVETSHRLLGKDK